MENIKGAACKKVSDKNVFCIKHIFVTQMLPLKVTY